MKARTLDAARCMQRHSTPVAGPGIAEKSPCARFAMLGLPTSLIDKTDERGTGRADSSDPNADHGVRGPTRWKPCCWIRTVLCFLNRCFANALNPLDRTALPPCSGTIERGHRLFPCARVRFAAPSAASLRFVACSLRYLTKLQHAPAETIRDIVQRAQNALVFLGRACPCEQVRLLRTAGFPVADADADQS